VRLIDHKRRDIREFRKASNKSAIALRMGERQRIGRPRRRKLQ